MVLKKICMFVIFLREEIDIAAYNKFIILFNFPVTIQMNHYSIMNNLNNERFYFSDICKLIQLFEKR